MMRRPENRALTAEAGMGLLSVLPSAELNRIARMIRILVSAPEAYLTVAYDDKLWCRSVFNGDVSSRPLQETFCKSALSCEEGFYEVSDSSDHPLFNITNLSAPPQSIRYYAGIALTLASGERIGTLCIMDRFPRLLTEEQKEGLKLIAESAITHFELLQSRQSLQKLSDTYSTLVEEAGDIIYTCNIAGEFTFFNRQFRMMLGYCDGDYHGRHFTQIIKPDHRDEILKFYQQQLRTKTAISVKEFPIHTHQGDEKWVEQTVTLLLEDGVPTGFQGIVRDIDARRKAEQQLALAMKSREEFLTNISHEIRTPLNATLGFARLLSKTKLDPTQKDYVECISQSGKNLLTVINNVLDHSKQQAGMIALDRVPVSLRKEIRSVMRVLGHDAQKQRTILRSNIAKDVPSLVRLDPQRLNQILVNLVSNAIKFTRDGEVIIKCTIICAENGSCRIRISVADSGIGIPAEKLGNIFDRFSQAGTETSRTYGGSGLGLAIVKGLVELQDGTICISSNPGEGSVFTVELPTEVCEELPVVARMSRKAVHRPLSAAGVKVLVADDKELNRKLLERTLAEGGFTVTLVCNGAEVMQELAAEKFQVVLLDIHMPVMDGYETIAAIRKRYGKSIHVIATTAQHETVEKERCIRAGMDDFISKPFEEQELFAKIMAHKRAKIKVPLPVRKKKGRALENDFDITKMKQIASGDEDFLREVLNIYIEETGTELETIRTAIDHGDRQQIHRAAHCLKSGTQLFCTDPRVTDILQTIETLAREENEDILEIGKHFDTIYTTLLNAQKLAAMQLSALS